MLLLPRPRISCKREVLVASVTSTAKIPPSGVERRRSQRVLLVIPVEVAWTTKEGQRFKEDAETQVVNAHGALLRMKTALAISAEVELTRPRTRQSTRARVVWTGDVVEEDEMTRVAVELAVPSETFWGVSIPPILKPRDGTVRA